MRKFNAFEKEFIRKIDEEITDGGIVYSPLKEFFQKNKMAVSLQQQDADGIKKDSSDYFKPPFLSLYREKGAEKLDFSERLRKINQFYEHYFLLERLADNNLISVFSLEGQLEKEIFPKNDDNNLELDFLVPINTEQALFINKLVNGQVFVTQTLRDLVRNDFKSLEEQTLEEAKAQTDLAQASLSEAKKQTCRSLGAVIVAVVGIIVSVCLSKCSVTLNKDQELFQKPIKVVDSTLLKLVNDSLNYKITTFNEDVQKNAVSANENMKKISEAILEIRLHQNDTLITKNIVKPLSKPNAGK